MPNESLILDLKADVKSALSGLEKMQDQEGIGKQFDEVSDAKALGHTFHFEGIECRYNRAEGHITSAKLEIGLRPGGSADAAADEIALQWQGTSGDFAWRRAIGTGGADGLLAERWDAETASDCVLLLDLEDLPTADGGSVSLLDLLDQVRALDVMVGRHTSVDYMILWLETSEALTTNMILE